MWDAKENRNRGALGAAAHEVGDFDRHTVAFCNMVLRHRRRLLEQYGISISDYEIIRTLLAEQERAIFELGHELQITPTVVSREVSKLVDRGLLSRRRPGNDRRVVLTKLTDDGVRLGLEIARRLTEHEEKLLEGIDAERMRIFQDVIRKIVNDYRGLSV